jgi:hypothetical protein
MPLSKYYKNPFEAETADDGEMAGPPPAPPLDYNRLYTDSLQRGMESADQNRVTLDDIDANQRQQTLRNVLSGFSQAAANVGGTQTVVPGVAQGFDEADKAALGARDRLASQGMQEQQRAIEGLQNEEFRPLKLEGTQLQLEADRRKAAMDAEATNPNSAISQQVRQYYKDKIGIPFPENISAADIKAYGGDIKDIMFQDRGFAQQQALQRQSQAFNANQAAADRNFRLAEREKDRELQESLMALRSASNPKDRAYNSLPEPQKIAVKELSTDASKKQGIANQIDGYLKQWNEAKTDTGRTQIGQQMIKLLNSAQGQDAVGAEEARRLANELEPYTLKSPSGLPRLGQDLKAFKTRAEAVREALKNTVKTNQEQVQQIYQQFAPDSPAAQPLNTPAQPQQTGRRIWSPTQQAGR